MKLATVRYVGPMRSHQRRGPSGEEYSFKNPMGGDPRPTEVNNVADATAFAKHDVFDVEWTVQGEVARHVGRQAASATDALRDLSYRQKQKLTSALGLDVAGNSPEEELEEALEPAVDEMLRQLNNQR